MDVVGAKGLHAADRGGKSDVRRSLVLDGMLTVPQPNITFNLNGARVFKSETKRKCVRLPCLAG